MFGPKTGEVNSVRLTSTMLFVVMAFVGVLVAYDQQLALRRFGLIVLGISLVAFLVRTGGAKGRVVAVGTAAYVCLWVAGALAFVYLFGVHWVPSAQFAPARGVLQPAGPLASIAFDNATAGILILMIPIGSASLDWLWQRREIDGGLLQPSVVLAFAGLIPLFLASFALIATGSRGAWFGLGLGTTCALYFGWRYGAGRRSGLRWVADALLAAVVLLLVVVSAYAILSPTAADIVRSFPQDASALSRVQLWHDMNSVLQDYRFTGSGLGSTAMVYSTYVLLLHVIYLQHAHQLYLQIAIEQGLPGLVAFLWMSASAVWALLITFRNTHGRKPLSVGATASLAAMLVHGLFDSEAYASGLVLLVFVPFGFAWALQKAAIDVDSSKRNQGASGGHAWPFALAPIASMLVLFLVPGAPAAFQANMGAVGQTRAELSIYSWPAWPIQDELRRSNSIDLRQAMEKYRSALALDPYNVTAHRRLGQIYLSQGNYRLAQSNLESAYLVAPDERATLQLLGEVYAVTGEFGRAQQLWMMLDGDYDILARRLWWYEYLGAKREEQRIRNVIALLKQQS